MASFTAIIFYSINACSYKTDMNEAKAKTFCGVLETLLQIRVQTRVATWKDKIGIFDKQNTWKIFFTLKIQTAVMHETYWSKSSSVFLDLKPFVF